MPPTWIINTSRLYNDYLNRLDEATLRRFVRLSGGSTTGRRADWIAWIERVLDTPQTLKEVIEKLPPNEQSLLAILRDLGGDCDYLMLQLAALGGGLPNLPPAHPDVFFDTVQHLARAGLALNWGDTHSFVRLKQYQYGPQTNWIFSDDRILAQAGQSQLTPPTLTPHLPTNPTTRRMPHLVTMELTALLQAVERSNGIGLTQSGLPRAVDLKKLSKAANWPDGNLVDGSLVFAGALLALVNALNHANLLIKSSDHKRLVPAPSLFTFTQQPVETQVRALLLGLVKSRWSEMNNGRWASNAEPASYGRAALFYLLSSLPVAEDPPFFTIDALDHSLFARTWGIFSILGIRQYETNYYRFGKNIDYATKEPDQNARLAWKKNERKWLELAVTSWLYFLGAVEIEQSAGQLVALRLTDLGQAALHPEYQVPQRTDPQDNHGPAWVVQPNFDLVAYLDRLTSAQLSFLERHAQRLSAHQYTAEYRLTRDSVYRGLESGTRVDDLLAELAKGSQHELPQNITAEIREWATQRERIVLRRRATLAEFPSEAGRELAIRAGLSGLPVGERFMLLTTNPNRPITRIFKHTINYDQSPQRNLLVSEEGLISFHHPTPDLLLDARLEAWSEPHPSGGRIFTRRSVQAAASAGRSLSSLLRLIDDRQYKIIPPLVRLMLRAWTGERFTTTVEPVVILRSGSPELTYALQQSDLLRPYLVTTVTSGIFIVRPDKIDELRALLSSLGLDS